MRLVSISHFSTRMKLKVLEHGATAHNWKTRCAKRANYCGETSRQGRFHASRAFKRSLKDLQAQTQKIVIVFEKLRSCYFMALGYNKLSSNRIFVGNRNVKER